jgi:hypothetical protein
VILRLMMVSFAFLGVFGMHCWKQSPLTRHSEEIASCFDPCVTKLVEGARRQMARGGRPVDVKRPFLCSAPKY